MGLTTIACSCRFDPQPFWLKSVPVFLGAVAGSGRGAGGRLAAKPTGKEEIDDPEIRKAAGINKFYRIKEDQSFK